jgi:hypothetical protein
MGLMSHALREAGLITETQYAAQQKVEAHQHQREQNRLASRNNDAASGDQAWR